MQGGITERLFVRNYRCFCLSQVETLDGKKRSGYRSALLTRVRNSASRGKSESGRPGPIYRSRGALISLLTEMSKSCDGRCVSMGSRGLCRDFLVGRSG